MPSQLNPAKPLDGVPAVKADLRAALGTIKAELEHGGYYAGPTGGAVERTTQDKVRDLLTATDYGGTDTIVDFLATRAGDDKVRYAVVSGYYTPGDGGGGLFRWQPTATDELIAGMVIRPTSVTGAGRWMRVVNGGMINVRWFGAKGDGRSCMGAATVAAGQRTVTTSYDVFTPEDATAGRLMWVFGAGIGGAIAPRGWSATIATVNNARSAVARASEPAALVGQTDVEITIGTSDQLAFEAALRWLTLRGGGALYVPRGYYCITQVVYVPSDIEIFGDGSATTIHNIRFNNGAAAQRFCVFSLGNVAPEPLGTSTDSGATWTSSGFDYAVSVAGVSEGDTSITVAPAVASGVTYASHNATIDASSFRVGDQVMIRTLVYRTRPAGTNLWTRLPLANTMVQIIKISGQTLTFNRPVGFRTTGRYTEARVEIARARGVIDGLGFPITFAQHNAVHDMRLRGIYPFSISTVLVESRLYNLWFDRVDYVLQVNIVADSQISDIISTFLVNGFEIKYGAHDSSFVRLHTTCNHDIPIDRSADGRGLLGFGENARNIVFEDSTFIAPFYASQIPLQMQRGPGIVVRDCVFHLQSYANTLIKFYNDYPILQNNGLEIWDANEENHIQRCTFFTACAGEIITFGDASTISNPARNVANCSITGNRFFTSSTNAALSWMTVFNGTGLIFADNMLSSGVDLGGNITIGQAAINTRIERNQFNGYVWDEGGSASTSIVRNNVRAQFVSGDGPDIARSRVRSSDLQPNYRPPRGGKSPRVGYCLRGTNQLVQPVGSAPFDPWVDSRTGQVVIRPGMDALGGRTWQLLSSGIARMTSGGGSPGLPPVRKVILGDARELSSPIRSVTGSAAGTGGVIQLTSPGHGLANGDVVFVDGLGGVSNGAAGRAGAPGTYTVQNVTANTAELAGTVFTGAYTSGGRLMPNAPGNWIVGAFGSETWDTIYLQIPVESTTTPPSTVGMDPDSGANRLSATEMDLRYVPACFTLTLGTVTGTIGIGATVTFGTSGTGLVVDLQGATRLVRLTGTVLPAVGDNLVAGAASAPITAVAERLFG